VPVEFLPTQPGHLSGCDICQDACPYNYRHGGKPDEIGPAPERWREVSILDLIDCDNDERLTIFSGSLVARITVDTLRRNAILVGARILRVAAGAPRQEALDQIAAHIDPRDLVALRAAIRGNAASASPAVQQAAAYALSCDSGQG
jgi:epoxyqueuosine reductase QueG